MPEETPSSTAVTQPLPVERRIERYVRCSAPIGAHGAVEIGMHYEDSEVGWFISAHRVVLRAIAGDAVVAARADVDLDVDVADRLTRDIDAAIVANFGDRPRFVEIWQGTGDAAEPLTQVYAPHGMPRTIR